MELVIEQGGAVVYGPTVWGPALRDETGIANRDAPAVPYDLGNGRTLRQVTRVWPTVEWWQDIGDEAAAVVDGAWQISRQVDELPLATVKAVQAGRMAAKRWEVETGGIVWVRPSDGQLFGISTDDRSQSKINSEADAAARGLRDTVNDRWKCLDAATGNVVFVPMTNADITDMAEKARAHVASAFRREAEVAALIDAAATVEEVKAIEW